MHRSVNTQENLHASSAEYSKGAAERDRDHVDLRDKDRGLDSVGGALRGVKHDRENFSIGTSRESRDGREIKAHNERKEQILMYLDMVGLAFIALCTAMEGYQEWSQSYLGNFQYNVLPLACWYAGRAAQTFALVMLIFHVHGNNVGMFEVGGMYLLTISPIINALSAYYFHNINDPTRILNKKWIAVEITEFWGIVLLDWSCVPVGEWFEFYILVVEVVGYYVVSLAALLEFDFGVVEGQSVISEQTSYIFDMNPSSVAMLRVLPGAETLVNVRFVFSFWRSLDAFGLFLLSVVAVETYRMAQQEKREHKGKRTHASSQKLLTDDDDEYDGGKYDV